MGLGRVHDAGYAPLPGGGQERGPGLQLVEFVCPLCRAEAAAGSHYQPPIVALRGRAFERIGQPTQGTANQHARSRQGRSEVIDWDEPVFEWAAQYCGAVEPGAVLGTDLEPDIAADPIRQSCPPRAQWVSSGWDRPILPLRTEKLGATETPDDGPWPGQLTFLG